MVFGEPTAISRLHLLMTFENYDDQQADVQKSSILPKSQNCTNWLFREHFSKVVKFVQFDAAISGGISAYWPSLTIINENKAQQFLPGSYQNFDSNKSPSPKNSPKIHLVLPTPCRPLRSLWALLLMVQKSGVHQLRLVVYPIVYRVLYIPGG